MMTHRKARTLMYDYLCGEIDSSLRQRVERHLAGCQACSEEVVSMKQIIDMTRSQAHTPNKARSAEYWERFAVSVEERIIRSSGVREETTIRLREIINEFFFYRRRSAVLLAGGLILGILAGVYMFRPVTPPSHKEQLAEVVKESPVIPAMESNRMQKYFRKSKMLLVGIENMKQQHSDNVDFTVERNASRELLDEARMLKYQPVDGRSAKLMLDLEKILIELANIKSEGGLPNVEIVRGGIQQENLLFKIRMAESTYDTTLNNSINNNY